MAGDQCSGPGPGVAGNLLGVAENEKGAGAPTHLGVARAGGQGGCGEAGMRIPRAARPAPAVASLQP